MDEIPKYKLNTGQIEVDDKINVRAATLHPAAHTHTHTAGQRPTITPQTFLFPTRTQTAQSRSVIQDLDSDQRDFLDDAGGHLTLTLISTFSHENKPFHLPQERVPLRSGNFHAEKVGAAFRLEHRAVS